MFQRALVTAVMAVSGWHALGQVVPSVSLDPTSPVGRVTADIFVDLEPTDAWTAAGLRAVTMNGATFHYGGSDDPNTAFPDQIEGPYNNDPVTDRYVTCVSRPKPGRNSNDRFNNNEGATVIGRYSPPGPLDMTVATPTAFNAAWFSDPPATQGSASVDGYIARVSLDVNAPIGAIFGIGGTQSIPAGATVILLSERNPGTNDLGFMTASFDVPLLVGFDWAIWYVPEPGTALGLTFVIVFLTARRRSSEARRPDSQPIWTE